jgi:hypothetical protein
MGHPLENGERDHFLPVVLPKPYGPAPRPSQVFFSNPGQITVFSKKTDRGLKE